MSRQKEEYVIGIDVSTGSVRTGIFDLAGHMISHSQKKIKIWHPKENYVEPSSDDIWSMACYTVKDALEKGQLTSDSIIGISIDATCSLVALDKNDKPISVSPLTTLHRMLLYGWTIAQLSRQIESILYTMMS